MAEDLSGYYKELQVKCVYLHSDVETLERIKIIRDLRSGVYDVLVGVNLLREGLDMPEVSLVAILDADQEGFLRSETSLLQTAGRAARNVEGKVLLYADRETHAIRRTVEETKRRRKIQGDYNQEHGITPATIKTKIHELLTTVYEADYYTVPTVAEGGVSEGPDDFLPPDSIPRKIMELEKAMMRYAKEYRYEEAAELRDQIRRLRDRLIR
jgi:excinuclease ABC subunit B